MPEPTASQIALAAALFPTPDLSTFALSSSSPFLLAALTHALTTVNHLISLLTAHPTPLPTTTMATYRRIRDSRRAVQAAQDALAAALDAARGTIPEEEIPNCCILMAQCRFLGRKLEEEWLSVFRGGRMWRCRLFVEGVLECGELRGLVLGGLGEDV